MLFIKRLREHLVLFAAVMAVVALVSGLSVGVIGLITESATAGVRDDLATRAGSDLALRATLPRSQDAETQDREVRSAITRSFSVNGQPIPVAVDRTLEGPTFVKTLVGGVPGVERKSIIISVPDFPERATLVEGAWPDAKADAAPENAGTILATIQADAAARLDLGVGDRFLVSSQPAVVVGTWRIDDYLDPRWLGNTLIADGVDGTDTGPVVIDEADWASIDGAPRARWTIVPDRTTLTANELGEVPAIWEGVREAWRGSISSDLSGLELQGRFRRTALELGVRVDGLRAIEPVALLLLVAIALVTLAELGRLLTTTRSTEIALLWSRGASAFDVARSTAAEVGLAAVTGAAAGAAISLGVLTLVGTSDPLSSIGYALVAVPLATAASAVLVLTSSAFQSARRQTVRDPSAAGGRTRRLVGPGAVVLLVAAAGLSVWQLRLYGSPVTPTEEGGSAIDPIAVVAPALTLVAVVLAGLVLFPVLARNGERLLRSFGVSGTLAIRTIARNLPLIAAPVVVVAVTCGALVIAAGYAATWSGSFSNTSELRAGSDVHVTARNGVDPTTIDTIDDLPNVDAAAPIDVEVLQVGTDSGSIVGVAPDAFAASGPTSDFLDRADVADDFRMSVPGPRLPADTTEVRLSITTEGFAVVPDLALWITDARGVLRNVALTADGDNEYSTELEAAVGSSGPWQILAVDVAIDTDALVDDDTGTFALTGLDAVSGGTATPVELDKFWAPETPGLRFDSPIPAEAGLGFSVPSGTLQVRMTPTFDGAMSDRLIAPSVISQRTADLYQLGVGDTLSFYLENSFDRLDTTVAGIVPAIPGAPLESAVAIDLTLIQHFQLRVTDTPDPPRDVWIVTSDQEGVAAALRPLLPANSFIDTADDAAGRTVLGAASVALWLSAAGCLFLTIIAITAVTRAQLRSRQLEVVVLRTIGLGSRAQGAVRRLELQIVLGYGALLGLVAGGAVVALTIPQLARAAVPEPYPSIPTPIAVDLPGLAGGLALIAVVLATIVLVYSARVAAHSRSTSGWEDAR